MKACNISKLNNNMPVGIGKNVTGGSGFDMLLFRESNICNREIAQKMEMDILKVGEIVTFIEYAVASAMPNVFFVCRSEQ